MTKQEPITLPHRHPTPFDLLCGLRDAGVEVSDWQWREALARAQHYKGQTDAEQIAKLREAGL